MSITEAQKRATYKYRQKIEELRIHVPAGQRELIKKHAEEHGESVTAFVNRAINETIENDNKKAND